MFSGFFGQAAEGFAAFFVVLELVEAGAGGGEENDVARASFFFYGQEGGGVVFGVDDFERMFFRLGLLDSLFDAFGG